MHSLQRGALNVAQPLPETAALFHLQAFLVGIVVPDSEVMPGWAKKRGFDGTYSELCKNKVCFLYLSAVRPCVIVCNLVRGGLCYWWLQ